MLRVTLVLFLSSLVATGISQDLKLTVLAGAHPRKDVPVKVTTGEELDPALQYELFNPVSRKTAAVQFLDAVTVVFILPDSLAANAKATYTIRQVSKKPAGTISIKEDSKGLLVKSNKKPLFYYHTAVVAPPADSPLYYQRSGFIHPLYSPNGEILTDDFPAGHVHQHALFAAWTNTTFRGQFVDFWNQHAKKGTVEHITVLKKETGPVCGVLQVLLRYVSNEFGEVLTEKWTIVVFPFSKYFLFDINSEQTNTSSDTLFLNKYHYGGRAFRGSKFWNPDDKKNFKNNWNILTSEGIRDSAANHTHARWVDASGMLRKEVAGVTVFDHPSNFRYPQAIRVHPNMPYWVYAPMVDGAFTIDPGKKYFAFYRYFVHNGSADVTEIERIERDYREGVKTELTY